MVGPWMAYFLPQVAAEEDMGDIEFIRGKTLSGDWITVTGAINAINDDVVYVPASGKTFFFYEAKIVITGHSNLAVTYNATMHNGVEADLKVNGVVKDTTNLDVTSKGGAITATSGASAAAGAGSVGDGKFICQGLSLVGDASDEVAIENVLDSGSAAATLSGWIENT